MNCQKAGVFAVLCDRWSCEVGCGVVPVPGLDAGSGSASASAARMVPAVVMNRVASEDSVR